MRSSFGVGLGFRARGVKGRKGQCSAFDLDQAGKPGQVHPPSVGIVELRDKADIGKSRIVTEANPALRLDEPADAGVVALHEIHALVDAAYVAGHSLGEYSALCAAGSLGIADAARLLRLARPQSRGETLAHRPRQ